MGNKKSRRCEVRTNNDSKDRKKMLERFDRWRVYTGRSSRQSPNWKQIIDESQKQRLEPVALRYCIKHGVMTEEPTAEGEARKKLNG